MLLAVLLGTMLVALVLVVSGGLALADAYGHLSEARQQAQEGRSLLLSGEAEAAGLAFRDSASAFGRAHSGLEHGAVATLGRLPAVGENVEVARAVAEAGRLSTEAGEILAGGLAEARDREQLRPSEGRLPLDALVVMRRPLRRAEPLTTAAAERIAAAPVHLLLPPVAEARAAAAAQLQPLASAVTAGRALAEHLPAFLGADGRRRYFFGASTPAESRGTGGLVGSYTVLTVDDGRLEFGSFKPSSGLPRFPPSQVPAPNPDYAQRYDRFGGAGFISNINLTPDFPSAASAIEGLYEKASGQRVDGAIVADPFALQALLRLTGPTSVPRLGQVDADNVVRLVTNEAYTRFDDQTRRKRVLGDVAASVFEAFLAGSGRRGSVATLRGLADAAGEGHLLLHARDRRVQRAFEKAGVAGRLLDPDGDYLALVVNNAAESKIDFYARRALRYRAALAEDGSVVSTATVRLRNDAPDRGHPYLVGDPPGRNVSNTSIYAPSGAELTSYRRDGELADVRVAAELGHPVWTDTVTLDSGEAAALQFGWRQPDAWTGDAAEGSYRLTVQGQTTIRPTRLSLAVDLPPGVEVTAMSPGLKFRRGRVEYEGEMPHLATFDVQFAQPRAARTWQSLRRFLAQPLW